MPVPGSDSDSDMPLSVTVTQASSHRCGGAASGRLPGHTQGRAGLGLHEDKSSYKSKPTASESVAESESLLRIES